MGISCHRDEGTEELSVSGDGTDRERGEAAGTSTATAPKPWLRPSGKTQSCQVFVDETGRFYAAPATLSPAPGRLLAVRGSLFWRRRERQPPRPRDFGVPWCSADVTARSAHLLQDN